MALSLLLGMRISKGRTPPSRQSNASCLRSDLFAADFPSGGAEAYLNRLARGMNKPAMPRGSLPILTGPLASWSWGPMTTIARHLTIAFADEFSSPHATDCDLLMSLERVWRCDVFRARRRRAPRLA